MNTKEIKNEKNVVVVALAQPSDVARTLHAYEYALDLDRNGIESELVLDGEGVKIVDSEIHEFVKPLYEEAIEKGILKVACSFCANLFQVKEKLIKSNILLSDGTGHVSIGNMIKEGKEGVVV